MRPLIVRLCFAAACAAAAAAPALHPARPAARQEAAQWPSEFEGRPLQTVPLDPAEVKFNAAFPGRVAKFTDGERLFIVRWITAETRKLHSSADCFRGLGYSTKPAAAMLDRSGRRWSCFTAEMRGRRLHIRERIAEAEGAQAWTDVSAWFWSALTGCTHGPWLATTVVENAAE